MTEPSIIQKDFLWWINYEQAALALGKYNTSENDVDTFPEAHDVVFYYEAKPTTLIGADITTVEPEIPERYQLALVDYVLRRVHRHEKETMANANYYEGFWDEALRDARAEVNKNKGAEQNAVTPFIRL